MDYSLDDFESDLLDWGDDDVSSLNDENVENQVQPNESTKSNDVDAPLTSTDMSSLPSNSKLNTRQDMTKSSNSSTSERTQNNAMNMNSCRASVNFTSHPSMAQQMPSQYPSSHLKWNNLMNNTNLANGGDFNMPLLNQFQMNPELIYSSVAVPTSDNSFGRVAHNTLPTSINRSGSNMKPPSVVGAPSCSIDGSDSQVPTNPYASNPMVPSNGINNSANLFVRSHQQQNVPLGQAFISNFPPCLQQQPPQGLSKAQQTLDAQNIICLDGTASTTDGIGPAQLGRQHLNVDTSMSNILNAGLIKDNIEAKPNVTSSLTSGPQSNNSKQTGPCQAHPFVPFDPPGELHWNYMQQQRMNNLPVYQGEPNPSSHYGMTVNGFHPQVNAQDNPHLTPMDRNCKNSKGANLSCKERNEREQKRAQKISDLIESLRLSMEKGGCKVEMKSKYHTLTKCTEYVKYLIKTTAEKEKALERVKAMRNNRRTKEQVSLRSDPDSVTSSLTSYSDDKKRVTKRKLSYGSSTQRSDSTNKHSSQSAMSRNLSALSKSTCNDNSVVESSDFESSMSEMTESNTSSSARTCLDGSTNNNRSSPSIERSNEVRSNASNTKIVVYDGKLQHGNSNIKDKVDRRSSVLTTDAVPSLKRQCPSPCSNDPNKKERKKEKLWISNTSSVDYEEVFRTSNIPQVIATLAGRIITWNQSFLKATGLSSRQAKRLTLFSLVKSDKLSNLFEVVGNALRIAKDTNDATGTNDDDAIINNAKINSSTNSVTSKGKMSSNDTEKNDKVTLPCIPFPSNCCRENSHPNSFFMTVTLIKDENDSLTSFLHCVLTDSPGGVTSKLLSRLYPDTNSSDYEI